MKYCSFLFGRLKEYEIKGQLNSMFSPFTLPFAGHLILFFLAIVFVFVIASHNDIVFYHHVTLRILISIIHSVPFSTISCNLNEVDDMVMLHANLVLVAHASLILFTLSPSDRIPPIIRQGPANQTLAPGTTAQLQCHVMGNPLPSIQWERDGQRILGNDERISLMENGTYKSQPCRYFSQDSV